MKSILIKFFWVLVVFSIIEFQPVTLSGNAKHFSYHDYADSLAEINPYKSIAVLGDLQRTSIWEVMMGREQNDAERIKLVEGIRRENPALLVLLGDMVFEGSNPSQWDYFDSLLSPFRGIPVLPVIGNHEYYGKTGSIPLQQVKCRFPQFKNSTWYARKYSGLALVFINSNQADLTTAEWIQQKTWFENQLKSYDEDPAIKGVVVFMHHPPYTNSLVTGDAVNVQKAFVKSFSEAKKTLTFITGHAHTYERFKMNGKEFIVSGAGGGPRVLLNGGPNCHKDECRYKGVRPFTYILLHPNEHSVEISVKGINKGEDKFFPVDSLKIEYANQEAPVIATDKVQGHITASLQVSSAISK